MPGNNRRRKAPGRSSVDFGTDNVFVNETDHHMNLDPAELNKIDAVVPHTANENGDTPSVSPEPQDESDDETVDILMNGLITKKVIEKGLGRETRPQHGDHVVIDFKGWLEDGTVVEELSNFSFELGDGDVVHALDLALPLAAVKETFELDVDSRFAYGSIGREPDVPPNTRLRYLVRLISVDDPPSYCDMPIAERLAVSDRKRERGNYYYRRDDFSSAVTSYHKALNVLCIESSPKPSVAEGDVPESNPAVNYEDLESLELKLYNNLAAAQLKLSAHDAAIKSCDAVLLRDPQNSKAMFRKAKALLRQGDTSQAISLFNRVLEFIPNSSMVIAELREARKQQQEERARWSRAAARMFKLQQQQPPKDPPRWRFLNSVRTWTGLAALTAAVSVGVALYVHHFPGVPISLFNKTEPYAS